MLAVLAAAPDSLLADRASSKLKVSSSNPNWKTYTFGAENLRDGQLSSPE